MNKILNWFFFIKANKHSYTNFDYYLLVILMLEDDLARTGISSDDFVAILVLYVILQGNLSIIKKRKFLSMGLFFEI